jgi:GNAT superfamily N-acetyltransferase
MQSVHTETTAPLHAEAFFIDLVSAARKTPSGLRQSIARLGAEHEGQLAQLLVSLDRPSRVNRFGHPASDACVTAYARQALSTAVFVAGVVADGRLVGVVEVFEATGGGIAEVAFAVHGEWRRRGLCSALLEAARRWAGEAGIAMLRMVIARGNWPMRQLANKAGARLDIDLDEIFADIAVTVTVALEMAA